MYCPVCIGYGHSPPNCPNKRAWAIRQGKPLEGVENLVLHVDDTEDGVKVVLKANGITPGTRQLENRKLLRDLANSMMPPRMIVFVAK